MNLKRWAIDIDRDDITQAKLVADPDTPLAAGQVRVHIDSYAMTANNITYAVLGTFTPTSITVVDMSTSILPLENASIISCFS